MTATTYRCDVLAEAMDKLPGFRVVDVRTNVNHYHDGDSVYTGETVTVFNPATQEERAIHFGEDVIEARNVRPDIDTAARDQWHAMHAERKEWSGWMNHLADIGEHSPGFDKGDTVEVFKGRKVPKGSYTLLRVGDGQYGPYADLRHADGTVTRFVSLDNLRLSPEVVKAKRKDRVLANCPEGHGETVWAFLFADSPTGEFSAEKLPFLCDYIEDGRLGEVPPQAGKWIRERFCK